MADAFQAAAAAIAVAELALKIYKELSTFVTRARNADDTAEKLRTKVDRFCNLTNTVRLTATHRQVVRFKEFQHWKENTIWSNIHDSLKEWSDVLDEYKVEIAHLRSKPSHHSSVPWIEKTLKQLELDRKAPQIERLESAIESHIDEISLSLNSLQIILLGENNLRLYRLEQRLVRLSISLNRGHTSIPPATTSHLPNPPQSEGVLVRCVKVAREIQQSSSICSSSAQSVQSMSNSVFNRPDDFNTKKRISSAESTIDVEFDDLVTLSDSRPRSESQTRAFSPTSTYRGSPVADKDDSGVPDSNDIRPQGLLDALVQNYRTQAETDFSNACFDQAESNRRRLIDCALERNKAHGYKYDIREEKISLIETLKEKNNDRSRQAARDIVDSLLKETSQLTPTLPQSEEERVAHSKLFLVLAEIEHQQFCHDFTDAKLLDLSEKYAKRAFNLLQSLEHQDNANADFVRSVKQLIKVYESKHDNAAAQTYRNLYLDSISDNTPLIPSISPTTSSTSASRLPHLNRAPTSSEDVEVQNGVDAHGQTRLVSAILERDPEKVEQILQSCADPNEAYLDKPPLFYAIDSGMEIIATKLLVRGARINAETGAKAPLIYAIEKRAAGIVKVLCDFGADVEASPRKTTPLLLAARLKNPEIVRTLCQHNARTDTKCSDELPVLHCAISSQYSKYRNTVCEVLRILLEHNADPNAKDGEGKSPLHHAIQEKDDQCLEFLLQNFWTFDLEAQDDQGRTPLWQAIQKNHQRSVELCLAKGAIVPDPLPRDARKHIRELIKQKRRGSNESSAGASVNAVSIRSSITGSNRRLSTATRSSARTSRSEIFSFFGHRSS